jgi:hypothetical protein
MAAGYMRILPSNCNFQSWLAMMPGLEENALETIAAMDAVAS